MTSSSGPGIGRSASPAIHRRGFGIRLSRARSFIARIVLVANARARRTPPSLGGRGSRSRECARERCEDRQVCMQRDPIQPANAKRQQRQLVLEPKRRSSKQCIPRGRLPSRVRSSSASRLTIWLPPEAIPTGEIGRNGLSKRCRRQGSNLRPSDYDSAAAFAAGPDSSANRPESAS